MTNPTVTEMYSKKAKILNKVGAMFQI